MPRGKAKLVEAPAEKEQRMTRYEERAETFDGMWQIALPRIKALTPTHVPVERLRAAAITALNRNPALMECTPVSVIRATIQAAQMGFDVSGLGGKCYLVPYKNPDTGQKEAQLQYGYRGLEELARRTGQIAAIYTREVYGHEDFEYVDGLQQVLVHRPTGPVKDDDPVVGAYAVAVWSNSFRQAEVMNRRQIEAVRLTSKVPNGPAWAGHYSEMAKKTVIRRLCKRLPDSVELARALDAEERMELGKAPHIDIEVLPEAPAPVKSHTEAVREKVARKIAEDTETAMEQQEFPAEAQDELREPGEEG